MDNQPSSPNMPSPEMRPGVSPEQLTPGPGLSPEVSAGAGAERGSAESPGGGGPAQAPPPAKLTPAQVAAAIAATPTTGTAPATSTPATAGDVDVIEPEWVDKAEEVVRQHQGDPYGEEEAVESLQKDYLQKRYGISVGDPNPADDSKPKAA